jgi:pyruvate dehydrogenase E2 component (dihydrolipoamide acetyltransferase)
MAVDVVMPQMGESIFEGTITKWLKKAGEKVERDEPLFEISTDKVDAEIPSPVSGVLKEIKVGEGQTVPIKTVVALIDGDGAGGAASAPAPAAEKPAPAQAPAAEKSAPAPAPSAPPPSRPAAAPPPPQSAPAAAAAPRSAAAPTSHEERGRIRSSPLVRKMAREHDIDLSHVKGTGAGGRISKYDIEAYLAEGRPSRAPAAAPAPAAEKPAPTAPPSAPAPAAAGPLEVVVPRERLYFGRYQVEPMSVMRQRIAEHMVASKRASAHVYSVDEADITKIVDERSRLKSRFETETGAKLTFMPFFIRASVEALRAFPTVNASLDGANLVLHRDINIGIAVALDWGLIVPVVKAADEKNFLGLQRAINDLAERARGKRLKPEEVQEGTFSITNPGVFGGLMGLPVINQPNVAILGIGSIQKRPVVVNDAIAIRSMVYLTLSYDHRVVDGAIAHQFLQRIKTSLENWAEPIL